MQNIELKRKVIDCCIDLVNKSIALTENVMQEAQKTANEYGGPKDRYDSYRNQQMSKKEMYASQLSTYIQERRALEKIDPEIEFTKVDFGAIVITNAQKIFISVGAGKIEIENNIYYAVSVSSPIAKAVFGKKVNDNFLLNGKEFTIQEIY